MFELPTEPSEILKEHSFGIWLIKRMYTRGGLPQPDSIDPQDISDLRRITRIRETAKTNPNDLEVQIFLGQMDLLCDAEEDSTESEYDFFQSQMVRECLPDLITTPRCEDIPPGYQVWWNSVMTKICELKQIGKLQI